ncbi:MAG: cell surface protein [Robiginitomaculum sp.]|nr:MAG: cell surface protein [Robiginitomaculum sp.]
MAKSLSTLQYLDRAMGKLRELGLLGGTSDPVPVISLLDQISDLDEEKVAAIARTLDQSSYFNEVVREQVSGFRVSDRYEGITTAFNSIRDDAKALVDQFADGKVSTMEKIQNGWMKMTRGTIASRFGKIKKLYLDVAVETQDQITREQKILDAYMDFRGAMKNSEVLALQILKTATSKLERAKNKVSKDAAAIEAFTGEDPAQRAKLELRRDEALRALQMMDKKYQIAKDLSDNLTIGYNTSEIVMMRLLQTTNAKERIYAQSISFFGTNETVLTALTAAFSSMAGLNESTRTLNAMKKGIEDSLETLSEVGEKVQEAALRAGYGPTVKAAAVKKLLDSVIAYQERSVDIIAEMRTAATQNSKEIRIAVEDGKRRMAKLAQMGASNVLKLD